MYKSVQLAQEFLATITCNVCTLIDNMETPILVVRKLPQIVDQVNPLQPRFGEQLVYSL